MRASQEEAPATPQDERICSVLHRVGFTLPHVSPRVRCALTAPFHPYPNRHAVGAVLFLWHYPSALHRNGAIALPPRRYRARCVVVSGLSSLARKNQRGCTDFPPVPTSTLLPRFDNAPDRGCVRSVHRRTSGRVDSAFRLALVAELR